MKRSDDSSLSAIDRLGADLSAAFERIETVGVDSSVPGFRRRGLRGRPSQRTIGRGLVWVAACAVIVVAVVLGGNLRGADDGSLAAQDALAAIAAKVSDTSSSPIAKDQFLHTRSRNIFGVTSVKRDGVVKQSVEGSERSDWISLGQTGLIVERRRRLDSVDDFSDVGRPGSREGKRYVMGVAPTEVIVIGYETLNQRELTDFPTDPQLAYNRVKAHLGDRNSGGEAGTMWQALTESLYSYAAWYPPELRAALVNAIGLVPGVAALGSVADQLGRPATAFALESAGVRHEIYFDPETAVLVATRDVATGPVRGMPDIQQDDLLGEHVVIAAEVVDALPERYSKRFE